MEYADESGLQRAELRDAEGTLRFLLGGSAIATFESQKTGTHYTYQVRASEGPGPVSHFVSVLTGPDHFEYFGHLVGRSTFRLGARSKISIAAKSVVAFQWVWRHLTAKRMPPDARIYHEGRCCVCGRRLTTPRSILIGVGPICEAMMGE